MRVSESPAAVVPFLVFSLIAIVIIAPQHLCIAQSIRTRPTSEDETRRDETRRDETRRDETRRDVEAISPSDELNINLEAAELNEGHYKITADYDGAWTFFNGPNAHCFPNGNALVSFVDSDGYTSVSYVDRQKLEAYKTRLATTAQEDDHNDAAIIQRNGDGLLLVAYTRHQADTLSKFRVSLIPEPKSISDWGPEITINHGAPHYRSYNNLQYVGNRLFNVIRAGRLDPDQTWYVMYSDDDGDSWSDLFHIHSNLPSVSPSEQDNCYSQIVGDSVRGRLWIAANDGYPNSSAITTSQYCYYIDAVTLTMHNPDGVLIGPIGTQFDLQTDTNDSSTVYGFDPTIGRAWNWDIQIDADGDLYLAYQTERLTNPTGRRTKEDRISYYVAVWDGLMWDVTFVGHAGYGISVTSPSYGGGIALDSLNPQIYYFSSNSTEPNDDSDSVPELADYWSLYSGSIGESAELIISGSESSCYRPLVCNTDSGEAVVFLMRGTYTHWKGQYDCAIDAWFSGSPTQQRWSTRTTAGGIEISFNRDVSQLCRIETSSDLLEWQLLKTILPSNDGGEWESSFIQFVDPQPEGLEERYFRVREDG